MMRLLLIVIFIVNSVNAETPSFIIKCKSEDSACLKRSAQMALPALVAGIPELNVQPLDPIYIDNIEAKTSDLTFNITNATVTGLKDCIIENLVRNVVTSRTIIVTLCDVKFKSKYELHGKILVLPIEGKGDMEVILRNIRLHVDADITDKFDKEGKLHWYARGFKYSYELNDKASVDISNLFDGNEVLGRAARDLINTSGNEIIVEVGPPIVKAIVEKVVKAVNQLYKAVPAEELGLD